jgi:hypothetical protein
VLSWKRCGRGNRERFRVETIAQTELEEAAVWYESQRSGLGLELIAEVDRVLGRIAHEESSRRRRSRPCPAPARARRLQQRHQRAAVIPTAIIYQAFMYISPAPGIPRPAP